MTAVPPRPMGPQIVIQVEGNQISLGSNVPNKYMTAGIIITALIGLLTAGDKDSNRIIAPI